MADITVSPFLIKHKNKKEKVWLNASSLKHKETDRHQKSDAWREAVHLWGYKQCKQLCI